MKPCRKAMKACTIRLVELVVKGFASKCHHRLIHFPYDKGIFPKNAVTFYKLEQPLYPLPRDPI